ncbi:response regulator transcription factor [Clostridium sp. 'deep sea']|uniref:response regulator transcription factor n=1 Tax=Clostridium sp. 'deep sea' TaxID=2779445 RepID=UPI0018965B44|nr:response regulator transcription factor [Clostridium sp. 'deep sea']QOR36373.1 response regulator transcription factor [Clostridium sp. 'deep sea']
MKILIIEDNKKLALELAKLLHRYSYKAIVATDYENIIAFVKTEKPHLILLDINLPYFDGFHFCREIRHFSSIPIIFLTSRNSNMDEAMAITIGGDDFITKPYNSEVLLARINAVLKRSYGSNKLQEIVKHHNISLNIAASTLVYKDKKVDLTKNELRILHTLILNAGSIVSRNRIIEKLWDSDLFVDDNTLTVNINRLRKKLTELGLNNCILTKRGLGYYIK